jgi:hypothetical protein
VTIPAVPRPLARRIDRLARRAHAFHRHAHHPLCEPYRDEVIRVGKRVRLCKGCTFLASGLLAGIVLGAVLRPPISWGAGGLLVALVLGPLSLRVRLPKLIGRSLPGFGVGAAMWSGWPAALASFLIVALLGLSYRRRGVERSRCEACHERRRNPCSGFTLIVRRERAFQRHANSLLRGPGRYMS